MKERIDIFALYSSDGSMSLIAKEKLKLNANIFDRECGGAIVEGLAVRLWWNADSRQGSLIREESGE